MKVDGSIKSLLQGVSQQPARERLPGQATEQINFSADPVTGLTRRPPTDLVGMLPSRTNPRWFNFRLRTGVGYVGQFYDGGLDIVNLNGDLQVVNMIPGAAAYLDGSSYATTVVGNDVYVSNRDRVTEMNANSYVQYANIGNSRLYVGAIVQIRGGAYGKMYKLMINGVDVAYYTTPDGSNSGHATYIRPSHIVSRLVQALTTTVNQQVDSNGWVWGTAALAGADWYVYGGLDSIIIKNTAGGAGIVFTINSSDDAGGVNMIATTDTVDSVENLPKYAEQGYAIRIATNTDPEYDMWMTFENEVTTPLGQGFPLKGFWKEGPDPTADTQINPFSMPHILEYDVDSDEFTFRAITYRDRTTGNDTSNPRPSFIGGTISDVSLFQSRLVFLSGNYIVMSRTNRLTDFFIGSLSGIVDTDPIDVGSNAQEASALTWIIPFNKDLVAFSPSGQFTFYGRTGITPSNATMTLSTSFENDTRAKPVACGKNIFFTNVFGRYAGVREFFSEISGEQNDTRPITQHIKKYIQGYVQHMAASSNSDMLLIKSSNDTNVLYMYQFIWSDNEKIQSAWSKIAFDQDVGHVFFDESVVYLVLNTDDGPALVRQPLDVQESEGLTYGVHLDYRFDVFDVYRQFVLPADWQADTDLRLIQGNLCPNPGMPVPIESIEYDADEAGWVVTLRYDMLGGDIIGGTTYRSSYTPTSPRVKDESNVEIANARLKIKHYIVSLANTGHVAGVVHSPYYDDIPVEFTGRIVGDIDNLVGHQVLTDEKFLMPVRELSTAVEVEFYTNSPFPLTMLDIEWVGQYWKSGRRMDTGG